MAFVINSAPITKDNRQQEFIFNFNYDNSGTGAVPGIATVEVSESGNPETWKGISTVSLISGTSKKVTVITGDITSGDKCYVRLRQNDSNRVTAAYNSGIVPA